MKLSSGPGSSVGIATAYGLDGPGIESRWGRNFPHLSRPALRPTQPPVQWLPGLSPGYLLYNGYRVFPRLVPRSKIPLLSLRAFVGYERVKPIYEMRYAVFVIQTHFL